MPDTCLINFSVRDTIFDLRPFQKVAFRPSLYAVDAIGGVLRVRQTYQVTADAAGAASVALTPGPYLLETQTDDGLASVPCVVPNEATASIDDCLTNITQASLESLAAIVTAARDQTLQTALTIGTLAQLESIALRAEGAASLALAGSPFRLPTFEDLLSRLRYSAPDPELGEFAVAAGDTIDIPGGGVFRVLPILAMTAVLDYTGTGGVKLDPAPDDAGMVSVLQFGAKGDSLTDDAPPINAAVAWATPRGYTTLIPAPKERPGPAAGFFRCLSPIIYYPASKITGPSGGPIATELRFTNDTHGFVPFNKALGQITSTVYLANMKIRGNADVSTVATQTVGLDETYANYFRCENLWFQDWCIHVLNDAGNVGSANNVHVGCRINSLKKGNPINGFPGIGILLQGGTKKPQIFVWRDGNIYAEEAVVSSDQNGTGAQVNFDMDLTSKGGLTNEIGVQVYLENAFGRPVRQVVGVDYNLFDITSGSEVAIAPGATYVFANLVRVKFTTPPAAGTGNVRLVWNDPNGAYGIKVEGGSGCLFDCAVGGWKTNCYSNAPEIEFNLAYQQITHRAYVLGPDATANVCFAREISNATIVNRISRDPAAENVILLRHQPGWRTKTKDLNQTVTGTALTAVGWSGVDYAELKVTTPGTHIEVEAKLDLQISNTAGAAANVDVFLERSTDFGATWVAVNGAQRVRAQSGVGFLNRHSEVLVFTDTNYYDVSRGWLENVRYRVAIQGLTADDTWTVSGSGNYESRLRIREVNPN